VYSALKGRPVDDWSLENMNPDMTPNRILFDVKKKSNIDTTGI
jgi:hypothetical protein